MQQPVQNTEQYHEEQRQEVDVQKENFQNTRGIRPHSQIQKGGEKIFFLKKQKNQNHNSRDNRQDETESVTAQITAFSQNINSTSPAVSNLFFIDELKAWKTFRGKSSVDCLLHNACQTACSSRALFLMHFNEEHISSAPNLPLSAVPPPLQDAAWRKCL